MSNGFVIKYLKQLVKNNPPAAAAFAGALEAFVLGKILRIALLLPRFFLRARSRLHPAIADGLNQFISIRLSALSGTIALVMVLANSAAADPVLRTQMDMAGDFILLGNTLAHECESGVPDPVVGEVQECPNSNFAAPDVYWRADEPTPGSALADSSFSASEARTIATLELPASAQVAYARLYWGGLVTTNAADQQVRLQRSASSFDEVITADDSVVISQPEGGSPYYYQSTCDVTDLVMTLGPGTYQVTDVDSELMDVAAQIGAVSAWYMVVFYELDTEPQRNLAIFDSLEFVDGSNQSSVVLSGFNVPTSGFNASLGVVAFEGEEQFTGDNLSFNSTDLTNDLNPADNFFNATRSSFGSPVSIVGDLPQLSGQPRSYSNIDMDVVDVTSLVSAGDTSATIEATSSLDIFLLSAFITSISTLAPDFSDSTKSVVDLDGQELLRGDTLQYTISILNKGSDAAEQSVLRDPIPVGVTYVPGTLQIVSGPNAGQLTDAAGDDPGEYDDATRTLTVRIGTGADGTTGGVFEIGDTTEITFQVTVDPDAAGVIANQGFIISIGRAGAPETETATDSDITEPGQTPTTVGVHACDSDSDCQDPTPYCDLAGDPRTCVVCAVSAHCTDPTAPDCNPDTHQCECADPSGVCPDSDGDGLSDPAEANYGTDPNDADSDDDGVPDGAEVGVNLDSDGDGLNNPLDPDSDNDGLPDGTELGFDCSNPGTDTNKMNCRADQDMGATITNPVVADTDGGGVIDGSEDSNRNGIVDTNETDPTRGHPEDDVNVIDSDGDGLGDDFERGIRSDPNDADTDNDGVPDGQEPNPTTDSDGDKLIGVLDVDSDNDGLLDGTEMGKGCDDPATDFSQGHCRADGDLGATVTSPLDADTDDGGVSDGSEDSNLNGVVDEGETDPVVGHGADDASVLDTDGDGLSDFVEATIGTDPADADSDDDGVPDGMEPNPSDDQDGDGAVNSLDPDSDDDGLYDGTELGMGCSNPATDATKGQCVADADLGQTTTSPLNPDTDYGTKLDNAEDANGNGAVDPEETDPNDSGDDVGCAVDADCGNATSGRICVNEVCIDGCRGQGGNGCPPGMICSSTTDAPGQCEPEQTPEPPPTSQTDAGVPPPQTDAGPIVQPDLGYFGGGGCSCTIGRTAANQKGWIACAILLSIWFAVRRFRRRYE